MAIGIKMPRIPRVTTKARNIARSFGYATMDVLWQYNPTIANLHQETKKTFTEAKTSMKTMSGNATKTAKEFLDTKNESALSNLIKDFKSGNWYNKRSEYDDENMGDNVEDWGDESKDSSPSDSDSSIFSTKAVLDSMGDLSTNLSNNFGMANIKTAQYIAETNAAGQKANYELTAKGFSSISNILLNINQKLDVIAESTRVNVVSFQNQNQFYTNTTRFFEDTTKSLGNINASLEKIAANTDVFNSTPGGKNKKGRTIDTLLFGDEFSFGAYIDVIKENVKEQTELYRSILGLSADALGKGGKNLSPMTLILTKAIDVAIPGILKYSMDTLNKTISHSITAGLEMFSQSLGNGYGIGNMIRQMLLPDTLIGQASKEVKFNRSNYNKGPVQWDGIARKSLVEVIPTYLAKINAALGGQERYYDYELGKFVSVGEIKNKMPAMREAGAKKAGGKFRKDVLESTYDAKIRAEVEAYFKAAFEHGTDYNNVKERSKDAAWLEKMGLSKESAKVISDVVDRYAQDKDSSRLIKFMSSIAIERNKYVDQIKKEETQGYSSLANLNNGFEENFKSSIGIMTNIYQVVGNIYAILSTSGTSFGGRRGRRRKSSINRPMFDIKTGKILSGAEYEKIQKEREEEPEDGTQTKKEKPKDEEKEMKKNIHAAQEQFKEFTDSVLGKHDKKGNVRKAADNVRSFFKNITGWYRAPFESMANVISNFSEGISQLFWGSNDTEGLIDKIGNKVSSMFDDMKKNLSDKWKDILKHLVNLTGIIPAIKDQAKSIYKGAKGRVKDFVFGKRVNKADQATTENVNIDGGAAYGRGITRGGLVAVSKGELIIPSEMNPFYNGTTNKTAQIQKENNVINKYGGGIKGYAKGNFDFDGGLIGFFKNMFGQAKKGVGKAFDFFTDGTNIEKSKKKIEDNIAKIMAEVDDKKGAVGLGALTGAGLSLLGTITLGPLASAAIGGGLGLLSKSKKVQEMLFGQKEDETDEEYEASMRARLKKLFNENLQDMGYGAAIGAVGGALMGSPVLGAIAGASIGYIKSSKTAQEALFGKIDENGKHTKYLGQLLDKMKQRLPKIGIGAGLGALIGLTTPLGLAGSIIVGAAGGFISDEQQFKDYMFGKRDKDGKVSKEEEENSFMGIIKHKIIYNIDDLHHNAMNFLRGFGKILKIKAYKLFDTLGRKFTRFLRTFGKVGNSLLQKALGFGLGTVGGVAKTALKGVGGALGVANRGLQNVNLRYGFNVYDRSQKRNLSAKERNEIRERNKLTYTDSETGETKGVGKYSTGYAIDKGIGNANDEQLLQLEDFVKGMSSSNTRNLTIRDNILKNAMHELNSDKFANLYLDRERSTAVDDLIRKGDIDKAMGILKKNGLKESEMEKARGILESSHKEIKESENAKNVDDQTLKILAKQFGIEIDPNNKEEAMATIMDLIKTEKDLRGINGDEKKVKEVAEQERNEDDFKASGLGLLESIYEVASYMAGLKTKEGIIRGKWKSYVTRNMLGDMIKNGEITNKEEAEEAIKNTEGFDEEAYDIGQVAKERAIEGDEIKKINILTGKKEKKIVSAKGDLVKRSFNSKKKNNAFKFASMGEGDREEAEKYFRERYNRKHKKRSTDFTPAEDAADEAVGEQKPKEKFKTVFDMFSKPHKYRQKDDGEWEEVKNDSGTDDSRSTMDKFANSIGKIPVIGGLLTKMGGVFSALKDGLLGNKKEKKKGIFDHLFDFLSGKADGVVKSALQFFTNNPVTGALSTMFRGLNFGTLLSTVVGPVLFGAAISGKFDKAFANLASLLGLNGNETEGNSVMDDNRTDIHINKNGKPIKPGEPIPDDAITNVVGSNDSLSSHLRLNFLRGIMTGKASAVAKIGKGVFNNFRNGLKTMAGSGNKIAEKLSGMIDDAGAAIAKNGGVIPALANGVSKAISKVFEKIPQVLKAIPFMPASVIDKVDDICIALFTHIDDAIMKAGTKLQKIATAIGKAMPLINIAWVIGRCINAWGDAESILGITDEATTMQRVIAVFVAFCNAQIPLFSDLIPDKVFINIMISILDKLGFDMSSIQEQRERAKAEVEEYNEKNGTDFTIEQYNQAVKNRGGVFTKLKNGVGGYISDIKKQGIAKATANRFNLLKNQVVAGAQALGDKAKEIGGFIKDNAIEVGKNINTGFGITDLLGYVKNGDIKSFLTYQPNNIGKDDDMMMKIAKNIPTNLTKYVLIGPALVSAVGHGLFNGIKKLVENIKSGFSAISSEFNDAVSMMKDSNIDTMGELLTVKYDNPENPINGIQKAILTVSRIAGIGFSLVGAVGKKIKEGIIDPVVNTVKNTFNTFTGDIGNLINMIKEGKSPLELISYTSTGVEEDPIFGGIMTAALTLPKIIGFVPSVISWAGQGIKNAIGDIIDKYKSEVTDISGHITTMRSLSTAGDVKGLLTYNMSTNDEGENSSFIQQMIGGAYKVSLLVPTGVRWIGNKVSDIWNKFTKPITDDASLLKSSIDSLNKSGDNGDIEGVFKAEFKHQSMFGGIMNVGFSVFKIINFIKAIGNKYGGVIKDLFGGIVDGIKEKVDFVKEKASDVVEGAKEKVGNVVEGAKTTFNNAKNFVGGIADNVAASAQKFVSGAGSGFVNQYTSGAGAKGCGPAVASMAANSLGKNLSVGSAVSKSSGYRNSAGVDAGYFGKVLGDSGIGTNYITGPTKNQQILNSLHNGNKVILLGQRGGYSGGMSKAESPFGPNNHYVLATGYDKNGLIINDPELKGPVRYPWGILNNVKMGISAGASGATETKETSMSRASDKLPGIDEETARNVYAFFTEKGYSPAATAGILGNMYQESKVNPKAIQGGGKGPAAGIVQWESIHDPTSRYGRMKAYAESKGKDWTDLTSQLEFVDQELNSADINKRFACEYGTTSMNKAGGQPTTFEEWKNSKDPIMATNQFEGAFERAGKPGMDPRRNAASVFYNAYSGHTIKYNPSQSSASATTGGVAGVASATETVNGNKVGTTSDSTIGLTSGTSQKEDKSFFSGGLLGIMGKIAAAFTNAFSKSPNGQVTTEDDDEDYGIIQRKENDNQNIQDKMSSSSTAGSLGSSGSPVTGDMANKFPYFNQGEEPFGSYKYPNSGSPGATIKSSGCGPTSMAMVMKSYGINVDPRDTAQYSLDNGFRAEQGTSWGFFNSIGSKHGLQVRQFDNRDEAKADLDNNIPVIGSMRPGDFTKGGHFIVFSGKDGENVTVNDPGSRARTGKIWNADHALGQAKQFWAITDSEGKGSIGRNFSQELNKSEAGAKATGIALSGGDSGLFDNAAVANSNIPDASNIIASIPNIDTSKGIDPQLVNKLIEAFSKLLGSIATNTAPIDKIYQLLASGQINVNTTGTSSTEENRTTPESTAVAGKVAAHSNNISEQLVNLSGVLAAIAKG